MSGKRYSEEFGVETVKHVTERGYKVSDVVITCGSLHKWIKMYGVPVVRTKTSRNSKMTFGSSMLNFSG